MTAKYCLEFNVIESGSRPYDSVIHHMSLHNKYDVTER